MHLADDDFDVIALQKIRKAEHLMRKKEIDDLIEVERKRKKFMPRQSYRKKDPKTSVWWQDYVLDERETFRNINHRDGRLFAFRFSHSFNSVKELVQKIKEPEENFWRNRKDAAGREAAPMELLVLGSLRILTRNVRVDMPYAIMVT
jgi:hypothetical protein